MEGFLGDLILWSSPGVPLARFWCILDGFGVICKAEPKGASLENTGEHWRALKQRIIVNVLGLMKAK